MTDTTSPFSGLDERQLALLELAGQVEAIAWKATCVRGLHEATGRSADAVVVERMARVMLGLERLREFCRESARR